MEVNGTGARKSLLCVAADTNYFSASFLFLLYFKWLGGVWYLPNKDRFVSFTKLFFLNLCFHEKCKECVYIIMSKNLTEYLYDTCTT